MASRKAETVRVEAVVRFLMRQADRLRESGFHYRAGVYRDAAELLAIDEHDASTAKKAGRRG